MTPTPVFVETRPGLRRPGWWMATTEIGPRAGWYEVEIGIHLTPKEVHPDAVTPRVERPTDTTYEKAKGWGA